MNDKVVSDIMEGEEENPKPLEVREGWEAYVPGEGDKQGFDYMELKKESHEKPKKVKLVYLNGFWEKLVEGANPTRVKHWLYHSTEFMHLPIGVPLEVVSRDAAKNNKETAKWRTHCSTCIHDKVCSKDREKLCVNYWCGRCGGGMHGCETCTHHYSYEDIPCWQCFDHITRYEIQESLK